MFTFLGLASARPTRGRVRKTPDPGGNNTTGKNAKKNVPLIMTKFLLVANAQAARNGRRLRFRNGLLSHLRCVDEEQLLRVVGVVWQVDEVVGRVRQAEHRVGDHVQAVHVADVLVQRELAVDLIKKHKFCKP